MNKYILVMVALCIASLSFALQQDIEQVSDSRVNIRLQADYTAIDSESLNDGIFSSVVALLAEDVEIVINDFAVTYYDKEGLILDAADSDVNIDDIDIESKVYLSDTFRLRELFGFTVDSQIVTENDDYYIVLESIDYDIVGTGHVELPNALTETYIPVYEGILDNYDTSYMVNLPFKQPAMLIIGHGPMSQVLNRFVTWKRESGMEVTVINKEDIAENANATQIQRAIREFYHEADNKPEYLLLIGAVAGTYNIPTFYHPPQNDATDLPYGIIYDEGEGYMQDMLVGRISVTSATQLANIVNKTIIHERNPNIGDWMERNLVVAGNFATVRPIPITPVLTSRWIADLMRSVGFDVTEIYWEMGDGGYGTTEIIEALNNGVQFVCYRGWGDANGWHYPRFHIPHLRDIQNGMMMPVVTSFVCNTGDFANPNVDPCFGEYWMRMGTPASPNGAVGFIGPSDLYTSTEFNNAMSTGFYWGVLKEDIRCISTALLRGKMEMYRNYPTERGPGQWMEHYFKVYNVLSDPSLNLWVLRPNQMNLYIPDRITSAESHIEFAAYGLEGGYVTVTRDSLEYETYRINDDYVFIPIEEVDERDIWITVTADNYVPVQQVIEVTPSTGIEMTAYDFGGSAVQPGTEITLNVTLTNFSDAEVADVSAQLSAYTDEYLEIINDTDDFGNIPAGGDAEGSFSFRINPDTPRFTPIQLAISISPTDDYAKIQSIVTGLLFVVNEHTVQSDNNVLDPGETADINVKITNEGEIDAENLKAYILSGSNAVEVEQEYIEFGNVGVGESANVSFTATAAADAFIGRQVHFQLDFQDEIGMMARSHFATTLGEVDNTAPTGPCPYGYYAYDSFDVDYEHVPTYDWIEIDPEQGGPGTDKWLHDDGTTTIGLPFTFQYYGMESDSLSICSNGWVSFIPTWMINFRNWSIPTAENPWGIIAPFWDDLKGKPDVGDSLRVAWWHDEDNERFIVTWLDAYNWANISPTGLEVMQLILEPREGRDGDLIFQYHTVWNQNQGRNYSTQGIQSPCNTMGLQYAFFNIYDPTATKIQPELAIRFTTDPPDPYTTVEDFDMPEMGIRLGQNYPNPFNPETVIEFSLEQPSETRLDIYNIRGQKIRTLVSDKLDAGNHTIVWDGKDDGNNDVGSGVYLYKLQTPNHYEARRMIMVK